MSRNPGHFSQRSALGFVQSLEGWLGGQCVKQKVGSTENLRHLPVSKSFAAVPLGCFSEAAWPVARE